MASAARRWSSSLERPGAPSAARGWGAGAGKAGGGPSPPARPTRPGGRGERGPWPPLRFIRAREWGGKYEGRVAARAEQPRGAGRGTSARGGLGGGGGGPPAPGTAGGHPRVPPRQSAASDPRTLRGAGEPDRRDAESAAPGRLQPRGAGGGAGADRAAGDRSADGGGGRERPATLHGLGQRRLLARI